MNWKRWRSGSMKRMISLMAWWQKLKNVSMWNDTRRRRELSTYIRQDADASRLDNTQSKLQLLYSKQGRAQQFATQAARDKFLNDEIKSLRSHERSQQKREEDLRQDVDGAKTQLGEVVERSEEQSRTEGEQRDNLRSLGTEVSKLKAAVDGMQEQRK